MIDLLIESALRQINDWRGGGPWPVGRSGVIACYTMASGGLRQRFAWDQPGDLTTKRRGVNVT